MTDAAYKVWEAFKAELIVESTDDMKEALANALRVLADNVAPDDYRCFYGDKEYDAGMEGRNDEIREAILNIANELEAL
jgi:hypothetical protein